MYRTIILSVVLYGCETWSPILREEHRLRAFENRVLRKIFGPEWDKLKREWRKLHNDEVNDVYSSPDVIWVIKSGRMRWAGHVSCMGRAEVHVGFFGGNLRERDHLEDRGIDGRVILKWFFK